MATIFDDTWYDIAVVYRDDAETDVYNNNLQIWLDGVLIGSAAAAGEIGTGGAATAADIVVGQTVGGIWYNQFQGTFDEFRFSSEALHEVIPEPSVIGLGLMGTVLMTALRRRR